MLLKGLSLDPVGTDSKFERTVSLSFTTLPKTVCFESRCGVGRYQTPGKEREKDGQQNIRDNNLAGSI